MANEPGVPTPEQIVNEPVQNPVPAPQVPAQDPAPVQSAPVQEPYIPQVPLPDDARDRTRDQFQKLIESNRRLYERNMQLEAAQATQRVPQPIQQSFAQPTQTIDPRDFIEVDPRTGDKFINEQKLRDRLESSNSRLEQLQTQVDSYMKTSEQREIERQERETFGTYPELNPQAKTFDPGFNQFVRSILTDSFYNAKEYGGRPMSFKEAADYVRNKFPKAAPAQQPEQQPAQPEAQQAQQPTAAQQAKQQASAQTPAQPSAQQVQGAEADAELADLRYRTRYNNDDMALAQRIAGTEHIKPKAS